MISKCAYFMLRRQAGVTWIPGFEYIESATKVKTFDFTVSSHALRKKILQFQVMSQEAERFLTSG